LVIIETELKLWVLHMVVLQQQVGKAFNAEAHPMILSVRGKTGASNPAALLSSTIRTIMMADVTVCACLCLLVSIFTLHLCSVVVVLSLQHQL
jgi:hypothetical protein